VQLYEQLHTAFPLHIFVDFYFISVFTSIFVFQNKITMKKIILSLIFISFHLLNANAQSQATLSILTCEPGEDVYAQFGHTAIRYINLDTHTDIVYNYGIFSFSDDFLYNFVKGETYYRLGRTHTSRFIAEYYYNNRAVIEQKLTISPELVDSIHSFLETNYLPENRRYLYNFFYDNCATRPRDVLLTTLENALRIDSAHISIPDTLWISETAGQINDYKELVTWRDVLHCYLAKDSWLRFGVGLALGVPTDRKISKHESMFIPDYVFLFLNQARVKHQNQSQALISETSYLVKPGEKTDTASIWSPQLILWGIFGIALIILVFEIRNRRHVFWIDSFLSIIIGILGVLIWYLSFFSIHPAVFPNVHIVWALPFHILFAVLWLVPKIRTYIIWYTYIYSILIILFFVSIPFNPQYIHSGVIALLLTLLSRNLGFFVWRKKK
jgi:hypothetical protein